MSLIIPFLQLVDNGIIKFVRHPHIRKMHENIRVIYEYVKAHPEEFGDVDILIQIRYLKEVLTNRAGSAPNFPRILMKLDDTLVQPGFVISV